MPKRTTALSQEPSGKIPIGAIFAATVVLAALFLTKFIWNTKVSDSNRLATSDKNMSLRVPNGNSLSRRDLARDARGSTLEYSSVVKPTAVPSSLMMSSKANEANLAAVPNRPAAELLEGTFVSLADSVKDKKVNAFANPLAGWHQQFVKDTPDAVWSPMAQSQAESYLASKLGPEIELISVRCGSTVCEVQGASTSAQGSEKAANDWQANMSAMSGESWWPTFGFAVPNSAIWSAPDGRALFVSYLTRETQSTEP